MLRQLRTRRAKLDSALRAGPERPYDPALWWDERCYVAGISDHKTIGAQKNPIAAAFHYASLELLIARHLYQRGARLDSVADLGSGAGHWVDWYLGLGAGHITAYDISRRSASHLEQKYADAPVDVICGDFTDRLEPHEFDIVNAIGVMFHVVEHSRWEEGLGSCARALRGSGWLIVSGHFGLRDGVDAQRDETGTNKRLRSRRRWRRTLRRLGFSEVRFYYNPSYLFISESQPESSLLMARR